MQKYLLESYDKYAAESEYIFGNYTYSVFLIM